MSSPASDASEKASGESAMAKEWKGGGYMGKDFVDDMQKLHWIIEETDKATNQPSPHQVVLDRLSYSTSMKTSVRMPRFLGVSPMVTAVANALEHSGELEQKADRVRAAMVRVHKACGQLWMILGVHSKTISAASSPAPDHMADWDCKIINEAQVAVENIESTIERLRRERDAGEWQSAAYCKRIGELLTEAYELKREMERQGETLQRQGETLQRQGKTLFAEEWQAAAYRQEVERVSSVVERLEDEIRMKSDAYVQQGKTLADANETLENYREVVGEAYVEIETLRGEKMKEEKCADDLEMLVQGQATEMLELKKQLKIQAVEMEEMKSRAENAEADNRRLQQEATTVAGMISTTVNHRKQARRERTLKQKEAENSRAWLREAKLDLADPRAKVEVLGIERFMMDEQNAHKIEEGGFARTARGIRDEMSVDQMPILADNHSLEWTEEDEASLAAAIAAEVDNMPRMIRN